MVGTSQKIVSIPAKTSARTLLEGLQPPPKQGPLLQEESFFLGTPAFRELEGKLRETFLLY